MFLLIHTMTITEPNYEVEAQYFHTIRGMRIDGARLVGRRLKLRMHPSLLANRPKANLQRILAPNLRTLMKSNSALIKHHIRTVHIGSSNNVTYLPSVAAALPKNEEIQIVSSSNKIIHNNNNVATTENRAEELNNNPCELLTANATPQETAGWLTMNRFDNFLQTFTNFSGGDMLRMTRDDLIQICGQADGIRLYNALHAKTIIPKLTIYVTRDSEAFHAIFLESLTNSELIQKLSVLFGVPLEQIKDIFIEGPQFVNVHLSNEVIRHLKSDGLFTLDILQENGKYAFLLKATTKSFKDVSANKKNVNN